MNDYGYPAGGGGNKNKNYEPFRLINVYKKAKAGAATLARKTKYTFKELADKVETWSRRDRS